MIKTLIKKEVFFLIKNPVGYVFTGLLLVVANWMYFYDFFITNQADLIPYWSTIILLFSIFIPAVSMNSIAEEKRSGNWELLFSLPVTETGIVVGKWVGNMLFIMATILLSIPTIIVVYGLGNFDLGILIGQIIGMFFLGGSYLALGIFFSSTTNQSIVAFLLTSVVLIINNLIGQNSVMSRMPNLLQNIVAEISLSNRLNSFMSGLVKINDVIFFISWIVIFLILTVISLRGRDK